MTHKHMKEEPLRVNSVGRCQSVWLDRTFHKERVAEEEHNTWEDKEEEEEKQQ